VKEVSDDVMINNEKIEKRMDQLIKDIEDQGEFQEKRNTEFLNILGQVEQRLDAKVTNANEKYASQLEELTTGKRDLSIGPLSNSRAMSPLAYQLSAPQHARKITAGTTDASRNIDGIVSGGDDLNQVAHMPGKLSIQVVNDAERAAAVAVDVEVEASVDASQDQLLDFAEHPYGDVDDSIQQSSVSAIPDQPYMDASIESDPIQIGDIVLESVVTGQANLG